MFKNFNKWNKIQKNIVSSNKRVFYHEREIWWCYFGQNIGSELCGKGEQFQRPVLILKAFSRNTCLITPLTTSNKENKYRVKISDIDNVQQKIILSQIKVIDVKRLINKIGKLKSEEFVEITKEARNLIF